MPVTQNCVSKLVPKFRKTGSICDCRLTGQPVVMLDLGPLNCADVARPRGPTPFKNVSETLKIALNL